MVTKRFSAGFDIGGTKCAVILGEAVGRDGIRVIGKRRFATAEFRKPEACLAEMCRLLTELLTEHQVKSNEVAGIGILSLIHISEPTRR